MIKSRNNPDDRFTILRTGSADSPKFSVIDNDTRKTVSKHDSIVAADSVRNELNNTGESTMTTTALELKAHAANFALYMDEINGEYRWSDRAMMIAGLISDSIDNAVNRVVHGDTNSRTAFNDAVNGAMIEGRDVGADDTEANERIWAEFERRLAAELDLATRVAALRESQEEQFAKFTKAHTVFVKILPGQIVRTINANTLSVLDENRVELYQIEKASHSDFEFTRGERTPITEESKAMLRRLHGIAKEDECAICTGPTENGPKSMCDGCARDEINAGEIF